MNRKFLAAALGKGVEAAAQLSYEEARRMALQSDAIVGDVFLDGAQQFVSGGSRPKTAVSSGMWRVEAIQELKDDKGPCVELYVYSTDGEYELGLNFFVRDSVPRST